MITARQTRGGWRGIITSHGRTVMKSSMVFRSKEDAVSAMRSGVGHVFGSRAFGNTPRFQISARATRGGWRGVATLGNGVVAIKTMPVFREKKDAENAMRAWLRDRGAHGDSYRAHRSHSRSSRYYRSRS